MDQFVTPLTLQQLLLYCSNPDSPHWESAWREFLQRYKKPIYRYIDSYCSAWRLPRLKLQFSEVVNDILNDVIYYLCRDEFKILKSYRECGNEKQFLAWLASICISRGTRYLHSFFSESLSEEKVEDLRSSIAELESDLQQELYETMVAKLRSSAGKKKLYLERDIHIFMLYLWSEFSPAQISQLPTIPSVSVGAIYRIIERLRDSAKK